MKLLITEVLSQASKATEKENKVALLKSNDCLGLRDVMKIAYDETLVWNLPEGEPPFKDLTSREGYAPTSLRKTSNMLPYFFKGGPGDRLNAARREQMFIKFLEGIGPEEAKLILDIKEKRFVKRFKGITKELVREVWPKILPPQKETKTE